MVLFVPPARPMNTPQAPQNTRQQQAQPQVLDTAQIAALLGVSRRHVTGSITKRPDFPKPVLNLSQRVRGWSREAVTEWVRRETRKANGG